MSRKKNRRNKSIRKDSKRDRVRVMAHYQPRSTALVPWQSKYEDKDLTPYQSEYIDERLLVDRCFAPTTDFYQYGTVYNTADGVYIYKDNGANLLAVAHLDSVANILSYRKEGKRFYIPQLDDRLGVHLILDVLHKYGLQYDILLTEGEETGRSTAQHFTSEKKYNWMFELDRTGDDAVMYDYASQEKRTMLQEWGFRVGLGSFTDICYLTHLGCWGVNFGIAYHNYHSIEAYCDLMELDNQLDLIIPFIKAKADEPMPCDAKESYQSWRSYDSDYYTHTYKCDKCQEYSVTGYYGFCSICGQQRSQYTTFSYAKGSQTSIYQSTLYYGKGENEKCPVCNSPSCLQMLKCSMCKFEYHDDLFVGDFSICSECLQALGVEWDLLWRYETANTLGAIDLSSIKGEIENCLIL